VLSESLHGGFWKLAAFSARGIFLVMVLPRLPQGELAEYVFISTCAILVSRLLLFGLEDEVPLVVRGHRGVAGRFFPVVALGWLLAVVVATWLFLSGESIAAIGLLSVATATGLFLAGLIRTFDPAAFEQLMNLPWIVFTGFALTRRFSTGIELAALMSASMLIIQVSYVIRLQVYRIGPEADSSALAERLWGGVVRGWIKLVSNLILIGAMRAYILWPKVLPSVPLLDSVAFALAWGEAFWQLGMVVVHRRYAAYSRTDQRLPRSADHVITTAGMLFAVVALGGGVATWAAFALGLLPANLELSIVAQSVALFSLMTSFWLLRYFLWAQRQHEFGIIAIQLVLFLAQGAAAWLLVPQVWFASATGMMVIANILIGILASRSNMRTEIRSTGN